MKKSEKSKKNPEISENENSDPKPMEYNKSSFEREMYSDASYLRKQKVSATLCLEKVEQTKPKVSRRK